MGTGTQGRPRRTPLTWMADRPSHSIFPYAGAGQTRLLPDLSQLADGRISAVACAPANANPRKITIGRAHPCRSRLPGIRSSLESTASDGGRGWSVGPARGSIVLTGVERRGRLREVSLFWQIRSEYEELARGTGPTFPAGWQLRGSWAMEVMIPKEVRVRKLFATGGTALARWQVR
jgi:hypothetical protein